MSFSYRLIGTLMRKNLLTKEEANEFFEGVLTSLEDPLAPTDPAMPEVRVLVDGMAQIAATGRLP
jgi:hypothetical protein